MIDWNTAQVGDPVENSDFGPDKGCAASRKYMCTRECDHDGQHVACTTDRVVQVWPQEDDS